MFIDGFVHQLPDIDPQETGEWLESLDAVIDIGGRSRARYLLARLMERAREQGVGVPAMVTSDYINTIPPEQEPWFPGDEVLERRIRAYIRWNAMAMVDRSNHRFDGLGGHLSTFASAAALYDVGFNHFFRGKGDGGSGDQVFFQGHAAPGVYARAFLEGRLNEEHLDRFRREVDGGGLPSYPHPRRMPTFWEFPTVSMGLGPLNAVAQARFNRYLMAREMADTSKSKVWAFVGDGEMDEPEAMAGLSIAAREQLDNLIFVVNCNLQRLDGPVRGNGKIIQELEAIFRGAGWNVIKVIWGRGWDDLLARDVDGVLVNQMNSTVDGQFQKYAVESAPTSASTSSGPTRACSAWSSTSATTTCALLPRGGHDYRKLYAAYKMAVEHEGSPTVILAKTVKGWTLGAGIESRNATHQIKKLTPDELQRVPRPPADPDPRLRGGRRRPAVLAPGHRLARVRVHDGEAARRSAVRCPSGSCVRRCSRRRCATTRRRTQARSPTCSRARGRRCRRAPRPRSRGCSATCCAIPTSARASCPIIPDEARTFGLDALFREYKIYAPFGQRYEPVDAELLLSYREAANGRILEEGITEAGSMATFTAAGTSYATWNQPMIPFFIFYSMFGFQRVGDLVWSFGDQRGRGFLLGATAGRTTLAGEGLQHCDGQSQLLASTFPNCAAYDPAFAYEMGVIVRDGIERMYGPEPEDCFYYLTLYNENYPMPAMPEGVEEGIVRGLYRFRVSPTAGDTGAEAGADPRQRHRDARRARRAADPRRRVRRRRRRVERDELQDAARRSALDRAVEPPAPQRAGPHAVRHRDARPTARARSSPSPTS